MKKHDIIYKILAIVTIFGAIYCALSFMGIFDGYFLYLEDLPGQLILGVIGMLNFLCIMFPFWFLYFYIKTAMKLYKKNRKQFYLWIVIVPIIVIIIIAIAVYIYWRTHQILY